MTSNNNAGDAKFGDERPCGRIGNRGPDARQVMRALTVQLIVSEPALVFMNLNEDREWLR